MHYFLITYGCQMNKAISERIATILEKQKYKPASTINEADLILVNMCSVRQSAVDRVYGLTPKFKKLREKRAVGGWRPKLKTILTGCILKEDRKKFRNKFDLILNIKDLPKWPKYLYLKLKNAKPLPWQLFGVNDDYHLKIKPKYSNNFSAFVPISNGCNNFCSYCVVPYVRGPLVCRNHQEILKEVKNVIKKGFKEIWLLGQNVNDYQSSTDPTINFPKLLKMIDKIGGDFKIFFTSPHPADFTKELIDTMARCKKVAHYLNLPVQSGDNTILKKMNRPYTIEQYKNLVKKIRKKISEIRLSTDVIVGFPGETEKQFQNTVKLFKEIKFDYGYIAKYSPRPGTAAFKLKDDVPLEEKKRREKILRELIKKDE